MGCSPTGKGAGARVALNPFADRSGLLKLARMKTFLAALATLAWVGSSDAGSLKALIIDGQNNHDWKATTPVLKRALEESKLFTVQVATAPGENDPALAGFKPEFAKYDVVVMNYNGAMWGEATRKAFEQYMASGGGLVVVHAANNSFAAWPAYNEMIALGGWYGRDEKSGPYLRWRDGRQVLDDKPGPAGHHGAQHAFVVETRAPSHPILQGLPERWLHVTDELYDYMRGPAKNATILATAYADPKHGGSGEHEPQLLVIQYGKGRVFHTMLGHGPEAMACVGFITTLQRGTEWAATGVVTQPVPADFPAADAVRVRQ